MSEGVLCLLRLCEKGCAEIAPSSGFSAAKLMICQLTLISNICIFSCTFFECLDISRFSLIHSWSHASANCQNGWVVGPFSSTFKEKIHGSYLRFLRFFLPQQIVDVCGGHGALAMLCLAHGLGQEAVIIDPSKPPSYQRLCHLDGEVGNEDFQLGKHLDRWKREEVLEVLNAAKAFDGWCNIKRQQTPTALLLLGSKGGSPCRGDAWSPFVDGEISYDQRPLQQVQQRPPVERVLCQQGLPVFHITFLDCRSYGYYPATTVVTLLEDQRPSTLLRCIKRAVLNCGGGLARTP